MCQIVYARENVPNSRQNRLLEGAMHPVSTGVKHVIFLSLNRELSDSSVSAVICE